MQRSDIQALALKAQHGEAKALREFKKLAQAEGYKGQAGGWIYYRDVLQATTQGWAALASMVATGRVRFSLAEARTAPVPNLRPLSPAMQRLVRALDEHGYIDP